MAGPGGVEEGRVSVRVVPDTSKFAADLRADLARIGTEMSISVAVGLDSSKLATQARVATTKAQRSVRTLTTKVVVDDGPLKTEIARLQSDLKSKKLNLQVDTNEARSAVADLQARIELVKARILVETDPTQAKAELTQLKKQLQSVRAQVSADTAPARAEIARLQTDVSRKQVELKAKVDAAQVTAEARAATEAAQLGAGKIHIGTDIDSSQLVQFRNGLSGALTSSKELTSNIAGMPALIGAAVVAAAALAPALAVTIPFAVGIAGAVGAIALSLKGLKTVFKPLADGFKTLQAPITAIVTQGLEPLVKSFTSGLLPVLTTGLGVAAGVVNQVLKAFLSLGQDTKFLGDLGTLMQGAATAFQPLVSTIPKVAEAFTQIGVAALPALQALKAGFAGVLNQFATAITNLSASGRLTAIITNATTALQSLGSLGGAALSTLLQLGAALAPSLAALGNALTLTLQSATPQLVQLASVIGVSLTAAISNLTPFIPKLVADFTAMVPVLLKAIPQFAQLADTLTPLLVPLTRLALVVLPAVTFALNGPVVLLASLAAAFNTAHSAESRFASALTTAVAQAIVGAQNGLRDLVAVFRGLPARIVSAVGDLSRVLVNAGEEIISGLINGITSQLGHLGSVLGGVGSFIKEHKGPASVDRVMLVPAGQMIMDGLIHGFESRLPNVKSSLGAITAALPGAVSPGGSGGGAGVQIENFYATDMDEAVRKLTAQQRDAAIVENVRLALVG